MTAQLPGPPLPGPWHPVGTPTTAGGSEAPSFADSSDQVRAAVALELGSDTDLAVAINTLTRAHQALNARLTDTPG